MWKKIILYSGLILVLSCNLQEKGSGTATNTGKESFGGSFESPGKATNTQVKKAIPTEHIYYPGEVETPRYTIGIKNKELIPSSSPSGRSPSPDPGQVAPEMLSSDPGTGITEIGTKPAETNSSQSNQEERKESNFLLFAGALGLVAFGLVRLFRNYSLKITRWTNTHKVKTRTLIAGMQVGLGALGVGLGKALHQIGYDFADRTEYLFGGVILLGLAQLALQKKDSITLMQGFHLKRLSFLAIWISMFMVFAGIGNKIGQGKNQEYFFSNAVERVDNYFVGNASVGNSSHQDPEPKAETKNQKGKGALIALYVFLALVLLLLLAIASCAIWCTLGTVGGIPAILLSLLLLFVVLRAMSNHIKTKYS